jgi:acetyl-CoA acetyltransferase
LARNPIKDRIAVVGVGSTGFTRRSERSALALGLEAATMAIRDAGLRAADIDGVVAIGEPGAPAAQTFASALGLDVVTHWSRPAPVVMFAIADAVHAIVAGSADTVLVVSAMLRPRRDHDPFGQPAASPTVHVPESLRLAAAYAAWANRYLDEYGATREGWGRIAVNGRTNAARNPLAAMRTPMTLDDYYAARMVREPLCMLDMDLPVDGADAFVLTSAERATRMPQAPVLVHAIATGMVGENTEDQLGSLRRHGQHVVVELLRARSDFWLDDVDLYYPYDGFTIIAAAWIENTGWCKPGEAGHFLRDHWVDEENRVLIGGRIPINSHGGSLSEGGTRGTGHLREAMLQLRGEANDRQVRGARTALVTPGGFFFNSQGALLRRG